MIAKDKIAAAGSRLVRDETQQLKEQIARVKAAGPDTRDKELRKLTRMVARAEAVVRKGQQLHDQLKACLAA